MAESFDLIVRGAELVTPSGVGRGDIGVRGGKIAALGELGPAGADEVFEAGGLTVLPGVIDTQVHFREPGMEWKEDLETGSRAARWREAPPRCLRRPAPAGLRSRRP